MSARPPALAALVVAVGVAFAVPAAAGDPTGRFLPDDPVARDDDELDVPRPMTVELSTIYDVIVRTLSGRPSGTIGPAANVNTLGEVPDSSWFTNRMGARSLSIAELVRGPDRLDGPDTGGPVEVIGGKASGITPGFTIRDGKGDVFLVKPDPAAWPGLSTAADVIGAKFFHAFGYNVPENYVAYLRRDLLRVAPEARVSVPGGPERPMTEADLDRSLAHAARRSDGTVRVVASRRLSGDPVGPFEYLGTRGDDANDVFPHEDRRELRGLRMLSAWLNHDDSRATNSLDTYVEEGGRHFVRHHLIDFSSALGSGSNARREVSAQNPRAGNEYIAERRPGVRSALTLGLWDRPWRKARFHVFPEIGHIEADFFDPGQWRPEYPNPAFERMQPQDAFWAGRIVSRFSDEAVRAIVHTGGYSDAEAEAHLADVLLRRRDKVVAWCFRQVNPLAEFALADAGEGPALIFRNLGEEAGLASVEGYHYAWFRLDNATGGLEPIPGGEGKTPSRTLVLPAAEGEYLMVRLRTVCAHEPSWSKSVDVVVRRRGAWSVIGVDREG